MERRLAAILVADVVGYSRLMQQDEAGTLAVLKSRRSDILQPLVTKHRGRVVKLMGDGVLVEFGSAVNAVQCAVELQAAMSSANAELPEVRRIILRIGVNLGDVMVEGQDLYGDGVNVAARLEALAEPGTVVVSQTVFSHVQGKAQLEFDDLGEQTLKNIAEPVRVYRVTQTGPQSSASRQVNAKDRTSIAVLPFTNMSGKVEQDYFADGITEDLITALARYRNLSVVARNSTFVYKGRSVKIQEVGRELGANFVVEGSVRQAANRIRVTVQLIDAETGAHVWAERFDREIEDIFAVQDEIVTAIVAGFAFNLDEAAGQQQQRHATTSVTAYSYFLKARAVWRKGDQPTAIGHLLEAVKIDPNYGQALGYLAFFYSYSRFSYTAGLSQAESATRARDFAQRAIAADKSDPFTLHRVAMAYLMLGEPRTAKSYVEAAATQSPRDIEVMHIRGLVLAFCGQHKEGVTLMEQACRLEPRLPPGFLVGLSDGRYLHHDYDGALAALESILDAPYYVHFLRAACLAQLGRIKEARAIVASAPKDFDPASVARNGAAMCDQPDDFQHWLEGFRKAGVDV